MKLRNSKLIRAAATVIAALSVFEMGAVGITAAAATDTASETALVSAPSGFDNIKLNTLYADKKLTANTDDSKAAVSSDAKNNGILLEGKTSEIEKLRFALEDDVDFGAITAGRFIADGVTERKIPASLELYIDGASEPSAAVTLAKQKSKGKWTVSKNLCTDISALKLTDKHKLSFSVKFSEGVDDKKTSVLLRSVLFTENSLPVVDINIDEADGSISAMNADDEHQTECYGNMTLTVPDGYKSEYSDETYKSGTYELEYIRGRGNSTWMAPKKPYKLKLEKKQDFFGMGANKHWVLLANYYDYTMMRNKYTYWLGDKMGMEFTPQCVFVDLVMNGEYLGSYYLCEHVRVGKSRVDIDDLEDTPELSEGDDITGGYLLSLGDEEGEYRMITTSRGYSFLLENPDFTDYQNTAQYNYIKDYLQKTEDAIFGDNFRDKDGKSYAEYLDVDSAIDYYLVQDLSMNGDAFVSNSTYLYKKRGGKLYWGPLWDFDYVAWGATEYDENYVEGFPCNTGVWYKRLLSDPEFVAKLEKRWKEIKPIIDASAADGGQIDEYARQLYMSQKANYYVSSTVANDEYSIFGGYYSDAGNLTFDSEVQRFKQWIRERSAWFDANIKDISPKPQTAVFKVDGKVYAKKTFEQGELLENLPKAPTKKGYTFAGWYVKTEYGNEPIEEYYFYDGSDSIECVAKWKKGSASAKLQNIAFASKNFYINGIDSYGYSEDYDLPLSVMPFGKKLSGIKWKSSNPKIATVKNGTVIPAVSSGTVTITATYGKFKASCKVHIGNYWDYPDEVALQKTKLSVKKGSYSQVKLEQVPQHIGYVLSNRFIVADDKIAEVDENGFVYGKKAGTTTVVVFNSQSETVASCTVTVTEPPVKKGDKVTKSGLKYKVTRTGKSAAVTLTGAKTKTLTSATIPASIKLQGKAYKVTKIAANAFKGCKKLKTITIKSKKITKIGKNAFSGISKTAKVTVPKSKKTAYKAMLKAAGLPKKAKVK